MPAAILSIFLPQHAPSLQDVGSPEGGLNHFVTLFVGCAGCMWLERERLNVYFTVNTKTEAVKTVTLC